MKIEALESALIETKLRSNRERERVEQELAELESKLYNMQNEGTKNDHVAIYQNTLKDKNFKQMDDSSKVRVMENMIKGLTTSYASATHIENSLLNDQAYQDIDDTKKVKMMELATKRLVANVRSCMLEKK